MRDEPLHILVCEKHSDTVRAAVAREGLEGVTVTAITPFCEVSTGKTERIAAAISSYGAGGKAILIGSHCLGRQPSELDELDVVHHFESCFHLLTNASIIDEKLAAGAHLMLPYDLIQWRRHLDEQGFDRETARRSFGETTSRLVLFETTVNDDAAEQLEELGEYLELPTERVFVGLDVAGLHLQSIASKELARREIAAQERSYHSLYDQAPVGYITVNGETGTIRRCNQTLADLLGYDRDELVGTHVLKLYAGTPQGIGRGERVFKRFRLGGGSQDAELQMRRKDGQTIWVSLSVKPVLSEDGEVTESWSTVRDVTDEVFAREALEESRERYRALFSEASDAIILADPRTVTILEFNDKAHENLGYTREEFAQLDITDIEAFDPKETILGRIATIMEEGASSFEARHLAKDGSLRDVLIKSRVLNLRDQQYIQSLWIDITSQKDVQRAMAAARQAAEAATQAKSEFLAVLSHEIRNPLNAVIGMSGLLLDTDLVDSQREYARIVRDSAQALLYLVNDILDFSKLEAGKLELEITDFNLVHLLVQAIELSAPQTRGSEVPLNWHIDPEVPVALRGDSGRIRQILVNLVSNAVKFTKRGSVDIRVGLREIRDSTVELLFEVIDTGVGISPEHVSTIFEFFTQVDYSSTREEGGTGLGLAIARGLVSTLGGEIGVDSTVGVGSTFWFRLELEPVPENEEKWTKYRDVSVPSVEQGGATAATSRLCRVLVVDDGPLNQQVALIMLEQLGCKADAVSSGAEALAALEMIPYGLVLMDCQMPEMDGYDATEEIRRRAELDDGHSPIVVAMTADARAENRDRCLASGMNDYLPKPVTIEALEDMIRKWGKDVDDVDQERDEPREESKRVAAELELDSLRRLTAGRPDRYSMLIQTFVDNAQQQVAAIKKALGRKDMGQVLAQAHSLRGAAGTFGAVGISALAGTLEELARDGEVEHAQKLVEDVESALSGFGEAAQNSGF